MFNNIRNYICYFFFEKISAHKAEMVIYGIMAAVSLGIGIAATGDMGQALARSRGH